MCSELQANGNSPHDIKWRVPTARFRAHSWYLFQLWLKCEAPLPKMARFRTSCVAAVFDSGFNQHEGVNLVFAAVVHRLAAADGERVAVVTGRLTCLPEFSWDQSGIRLTEATCSERRKKKTLLLLLLHTQIVVLHTALQSCAVAEGNPEIAAELSTHPNQTRLKPRLSLSCCWVLFFV